MITEYFEGSSGKWSWQIKRDDGTVVAVSTESYDTELDVMAAVDDFNANFQVTPTIESTPLME